MRPIVTDPPPDRVLMTIAPGLPSETAWPGDEEAWPEETLRWQGDHFLLPRLPLAYDDWGIRDAWQAPLLLRMVADVQLPSGDQRLLVRVRGMSRLWVDGQLVAQTDAVTARPPDGEEPITPLAQPPLPGVRPHGYRQQEVIGDVELPDRDDGSLNRCRVVLEVVVGGKDKRTETGEVCVARLADDGRTYQLLCPAPAQPIPLADAAVQPALERIETTLVALEDQRRRQLAASIDGYWQRRHDDARTWAGNNPPPAVPELADASIEHPIDAFIAAKLDTLAAGTPGEEAQRAGEFYDQVLPTLRQHCFRCHGDKDNGGLKLDSHAALLDGGDSQLPLVVPGDPDASELVVRIRGDDGAERMPPTGPGLNDDQIELLVRWVRQGADWPDPPLEADALSPAPLADDAALLRRASLDTLGVPPTADQVRRYLADPDPQKFQRLVDRLLDDPRFADHWISFWLDLLAENPTLINASLNSTGPFRWFLYEALRDDKPLDRMVTELVMMRGDAAHGGSAGFALAGENDAPFAEKGHILASAFLGIELQCARCHDSPYHSTTQADLFSLAAMLQRQAISVPSTSRVPDAFFEGQSRQSLIRVTLAPEQAVGPRWPFADVTGVEQGPWLDELLHSDGDRREQLAALITAPQNRRFAQVVVNRFWRQLIGAGIVEPVHDWEGARPSHPELLEWLADQLIRHDYDVKHVLRLIMTSRLYRSQAMGRNVEADAAQRLFTAPQRRRMTAEQVVDSLHHVAGAEMDVEELTFVHDGRRPLGKRQTLGRPRRAWMFATLNNERDRPSLTLPKARIVADVLEAFGWTGSRQKPITQRQTDANVLQPGILANGTLTMTLTRAAADSSLARLAIEAESPAELAQSLMLRVLGRPPKPAELQAFQRLLAEGFDTRLVPPDELQMPASPEPLPQVTWFNHLQAEANEIQLENERRVRRGPPPDPRLQPAWRTAYEDAIWSLVNHREFVWIP